jgi:hypothetical protein
MKVSSQVASEEKMYPGCFVEVKLKCGKGVAGSEGFLVARFTMCYRGSRD